MSEFSLIRSLLKNRGSAPPEVEVDAGDDAAVLKPARDRSTVFTCDTMVETVHFRTGTMEPDDIGWKCMAANISDVAAMGGTPSCALVSLAVPETWRGEELKGLYAGMREICRRFGVRIVGGDTVRSPEHLVVTVALIGEVEPDRSLLRSHGRPGDVVFVTGELGASKAGLHLLMSDPHPELLRRYPGLVEAHRRPVPGVEAGRWLLGTGQRIACDDVSDGLAQEAWEIAEASRVRLVLEGERIPISSETRRYAEEVGEDPLEWAFSGGEDFCLVGTVSREHWPGLMREAEDSGLRLFPIGWVEEGSPGVDWIVDGNRKERTRRGYDHFTDG
ncbi:thiamine-phosphate kinase [Melghirimyces profundicolus]|uniref:Thiamine-monophosphate kinase n=1 Tax=Melghirimyces profundicolus TaxID=1242148 RepID=A0A2T6BRZ0_9BACL|nr:thiamine-phosphate kinase [Melghirimyces profundicolus]PTX58850.1 thiamine-phosphate kinase [Melghirimyces profundicolus]